MRTRPTHVRALIVLTLFALGGCTHSSEPARVAPLAPTEGMWLPNALPVERLTKDFGFTPTQAWADHLRLASVDVGASGSFVSPDGLILTNHHVALDGLHNISTQDHDYVANGFYAKSLADEVKLPGQEVSVL